MRRRFNITGLCSPERHYMVRLNDRLKKIKEDYIDYGSYFVINRGRQYGKTTTLRSLKNICRKSTLWCRWIFKNLEQRNLQIPIFLRVSLQKCL